MLKLVESPWNNIQFDIDPNAVSPVENPILWRWKTEENPQPEQAGVYQIQFNSSDSLSEGDSFQLFIRAGRATDITREYVFSTSPSNDNSLPITNQAELIAERMFFLLNQDAQLSSLYSVSFGPNNSVILSAKITGRKYFIDLVNPKPAAVGGVVSATELTQAEDGFFANAVTTDGYTVSIKLFVDFQTLNKNRFLDATIIPAADAQWQEIGEFRKVFSGKNEFSFDVSEALKPFVSTRAPFYRQTIPSVPQPYPEFELANELIGRYSLLVWAEYDEFVQASAWIKQTKRVGSYGFGNSEEEGQLWFVNSALPRQLNESEVYARYYFDYWRRKVKGGGFRRLKPLTLQPQRKRIDRRQVEYLYFLNDRFQGNALAVTVDYRFEDGTELLNQDVGIQAPMVSPGAGSAYYVEVSPRRMNLESVEASAGSRVKSYSVTVRESGAGFNQPYLQEQTYVLDNDYACKPNDATLLFLNPLGGFDSVFLKGVLEKSLDVERFEHNTTLQHKTVERRQGDPHTDYKLVSERLTYNADAQAQYVARTGWMDKEHYQWLKGLATSTEVYMIAQSDIDQLANSGAVPRLVTVDSFNWNENSREQMYAAEVGLRLGYDLATIRG